MVEAKLNLLCRISLVYMLYARMWLTAAFNVGYPQSKCAVPFSDLSLTLYSH